MKWQTSPTQVRTLALAFIISVAQAGLAENETNGTPTAPPKALPAPDFHAVPPPIIAALSEKRPPSKVQLSPWAAEIAKLWQAGIEDGVMYAFIDSSGMFNLDADQVIRLRELAVPSPFITAMIQHDTDIASGVRPLATSTVPSTLPSIRMYLAPASDASRDESKQQPVASAPAAPVNNATDLEFEEWFQVTRDNGDPAKAIAAPNGELVSLLAGNQTKSATKENFYRVREPYPEAITPPIVMYKAQGLTPNTIVIVFSP